MSIPTDQQRSVIDSIFLSLHNNFAEVMADTNMFLRFQDGSWEFCVFVEATEDTTRDFDDSEVILRHSNLMELSLLVKEMGAEG